MTLTYRVQRLLGGGEGDKLYQCGKCGERFEYDRQVCSDCGSYLIQRTTYDDLVGVE